MVTQLNPVEAGTTLPAETATTSVIVTNEETATATANVSLFEQAVKLGVAKGTFEQFEQMCANFPELVSWPKLRQAVDSENAKLFGLRTTKMSEELTGTELIVTSVPEGDLPKAMHIELEHIGGGVYQFRQLRIPQGDKKAVGNNGSANAPARTGGGGKGASLEVTDKTGVNHKGTGAEVAKSLGIWVDKPYPTDWVKKVKAYAEKHELKFVRL